MQRDRIRTADVEAARSQHNVAGDTSAAFGTILQQRALKAQIFLPFQLGERHRRISPPGKRDLPSADGIFDLAPRHTTRRRQQLRNVNLAEIAFLHRIRCSAGQMDDSSTLSSVDVLNRGIHVAPDYSSNSAQTSEI